MMKIFKEKYIYPLLFLTLMLYACQDAGVNNPGSEYMPEMAHSIAFEANTYTYYPRNTFSTPEEYYAFVQPRQPVEGTVPRGSVNTDMHPYYYGDSEDERARATAEILENPIPITEAGLARGERLFNIYCAICHGEKGDSKGYLVRDDGGKFLALPANFMSDDLLNSSNGRYYHAIMYGRNTMGNFSDKLDYQERWEVIQHIRSMQAELKGLEYNHLVNTFNTTDTPGGEVEIVEEEQVSDASEKVEESHGNGDH